MARGRFTTMQQALKIGLTAPCGDCPFRTDRPFSLHPQRAQEIADALEAEQTFWCHKTVDYDAMEDGEEEEDSPRGAAVDRAQHCAGAMIVLERMGLRTGLMHVMADLGIYDPSKLDLDGAPVYETLEAFVEAMKHGG